MVASVSPPVSPSYTILTDVDGVLLDFTGAVCDALGCPVETVTEYNLGSCLTPEQMKTVEKLSRQRGFCSVIPWYPGARDFLAALLTWGDVYAVTAPWKAVTWAWERTQVLSSHLSPSRVLSVPAEAKSLVRGDVLLEDNPKIGAAWLERHPGGLVILFDRPWNRPTSRESYAAHPRMKRVGTYDQALSLLRSYLNA